MTMNIGDVKSHGVCIFIGNKVTWVGKVTAVGTNSEKGGYK
jgi:hypothetical protein